MDDEPHDWTEADLATLADLTAACTSELQLRIAHERATRMQNLAIQATRRNRLLLMLSEAFADATSVQDVGETLAYVASSAIGARYAGLAVVDPSRKGLTYTSLDHLEPGLRPSSRHARLDAPDRIVSFVARSQQSLFFRDQEEILAAFPEVADVINPTVGSRALLPVISGTTLLAVIFLGWERGKVADDESLSRAGLAGFVAHALERVRLLEERRDAATTLQAAMLTELPRSPPRAGVDLLPATLTDQVGGDWYDAVVHDEDASVLMIGDVTGHDMRAAAEMGQLRSMLRTFAWSHDESPSALLRLLDRANSGLALHASGTAVVVRLDRRGDFYDLSWSNAGHPPLILRADGKVEMLDTRPDMMLGFVPNAARSDHLTHLGPGDTLLLYTDGLIERRGVSQSSRLAGLAQALVALRHGSTLALPNALVKRLVGSDQRDDIAVLAVRVRAAVDSRPTRRAPPGRRGASSTRPRRSPREALGRRHPRELSDQPRPASHHHAPRERDAHQRGPARGGAARGDRRGEQHARPRRSPRRLAGRADAPRPAPHETGGRGIQFLDRFADRWYVEQRTTGGPGKTVWFELSRDDALAPERVSPGRANV
ncbi:SpoIIE family protein phosphatase [Oerskovia sp. M15]